jgi:hypothetical protein
MKPNTSPKSKPFAAKGEPEWLEWEDTMLGCCRAIYTLADLLVNVGRNGTVTVELANDTGAMIKAEVTCLRQRVKSRPGRGAQ